MTKKKSEMQEDNDLASSNVDEMEEARLERLRNTRVAVGLDDEDSRPEVYKGLESKTAWKRSALDVDGYPVPKAEITPGPEDYQGLYTNAGYYVPTEEEFRDRFSDVPIENDISSDSFRLQAWAAPNMRKLQVRTKSEASQMGKDGISEKKRLQQEKRELKKRRDMLIEMAKEELTDAERQRLKPSQILQIVMEDAYLHGENEMAVDIATKLLEYEKPKLARVINTDAPMEIGKASDQDMDDFINGKITAEEFEKRTKGG